MTGGPISGASGDGRGGGRAGRTDSRRRGRNRRIVQGAITLVVVGAAFLGVIPRIADLDTVWSIVRRLSWTEYSILVALAAWNIVTYWPMLVAAMPGLTLGQAAVVCQSSTSVAMTLPGGGAVAVGVSYAMYTSWGFTMGDIALSALLTGIVNVSFKLILPVISLAVLAAKGEGDNDLLSTALAAVGAVMVTFLILAEMIRRERFAYRVGVLLGSAASFLRRIVGLPPVTTGGEAALRFRSKLIRVLRNRGWMLAGAEVLSQLSLFFVLLAALRFVGVPEEQVSWGQVLAVFAFVRLGTAVPIVPGNLGIVELGYIGGLVLAGAPRPETVAAVLVFRFLTFFAQIPLGGVTYLIWRRHRTWRRARSPASEEHSQGHARQVDGPPHRHGGAGVVQDHPDREHEEAAVPSPEEHDQRMLLAGDLQSGEPALEHVADEAPSVGG